MAEQNRDVFAVPGLVSSPLSQPPLELIRDGATLIRGADDLLAEHGRPGARDRVLVHRRVLADRLDVAQVALERRAVVHA